MDRIICYPGAIPLDTDVLNTQRNTMLGLGGLAGAMLGINTQTVVSGLACTPTAPTSMTVNVGPGSILQYMIVDGSSFGSLPADTADSIQKMGINLASTPFTLTAPTTSGQTINYLIQASLIEADANPVTLPYYNSANPAQPFSGPNNSGTPQNTARTQRVQLQLKAGAPANAGTQVTPTVDNGWVGLWVISVNFGATSVVSGNIVAATNRPLLAGMLNSHHGGVPGQAPKIHLDSEVQGVLPLANLPTLGTGNLPFTPVQQGGGTGQLNNKVEIGWDGSALRGQVDTNDQGKFVMSPASHAIILGWDGTSVTATVDGSAQGELVKLSQFTQSLTSNGWTKFPNGLILQWLIVQAPASTSPFTTGFTLPTTFPTSFFQAVANYGSSSATVPPPPPYTSNPGVLASPNTNSVVNVTMGANSFATTFGISIFCVGF